MGKRKSLVCGKEGKYFVAEEKKNEERKAEKELEFAIQNSRNVSHAYLFNSSVVQRVGRHF